MALALVATVTGRWFVTHRGLVSGVLTAGGAAGQLVFLPLVAAVTDAAGWRVASLGVAAAALAVAPLVVWLLRDRPSDVGVAPYGGTPEDEPPVVRIGAARVALRALADAARTKPFWYLAGGMAICGATTFGLIQPHFVPAAHDHGLPITVGAGLLALVGIFDIAGTIGSGWLTDRVDPRLLLLVYYVLRGISLMALPLLLGPSVHPTLLLFVVFYGLDWVATIPPTMALVREHYGARAPVVFGWVFASHQVGAAVMALVAGIIRDRLHTYDAAWYVGGALCLVAGALSLAVGRARTSRKAGLPA
jgi:predicted MFS family arabinose efflux permease